MSKIVLCVSKSNAVLLETRDLQIEMTLVITCLDDTRASNASVEAADTDCLVSAKMRPDRATSKHENSELSIPTRDYSYDRMWQSDSYTR